MAQAIPAALAIGGTAMGAATSAVGASARNRAIAASMQSQRSAMATQQRQVQQSAAVERAKQIQQAQQIAGRLRVAAGESGVGMGGSMAALLRQTDLDAGMNLAILDQNLANQLAAIRTSGMAHMQQTASQAQNPLLAGIGGGLQGLSTGLSVASLGQQLDVIPTTGAATG